MQADQVWQNPIFEVTLHRIPYGSFEVLPRISFGKDRIPQSTGNVPAFSRILYQKEHFSCHPQLSFGLWLSRRGLDKPTAIMASLPSTGNRQKRGYS
jgi:hypothetical protein